MPPSARADMTVDPAIFRAYDIRGRAIASINPDLAEALGRAFGSYIADRENKRRTQIAVGRDNRTTGEALKQALMRGLASTGATVYDIGMATSPALYFSVGHWGLDGGVNVSGSHNPPDENGFKLVAKGNLPVAGPEVQKMRRIIERGKFRSGRGSIVKRSIRREYFARLRQVGRPVRRNPPRVVVDTGNGVAGLYAPPLLRAIGCDVIELHTELDPTYPNHLPDPQMPENVVCLQREVKRRRADLGLAFDGDGDRLGVIDDKGERHEADFVLALLARDTLAEQPGAPIILDIKTSQPVIDDVTAHGGRPMLWRTGHSFIKLKMRQSKSPLAGEASGHLFYGENYYSDDALFAACKLLVYLSKQGRPLSSLLNDIPRWQATAELRVPCSDDQKFAIVDAVSDALAKRYPSSRIDGIRATFPDGWALVRASNTGPNLTLRFEARTKPGLKQIEVEVLAELRKHISIDSGKAWH
jgi:phosphomannomutase/phosphoglucomutase